jgi:hypothetical protein
MKEIILKLSRYILTSFLVTISCTSFFKINLIAAEIAKPQQVEINTTEMKVTCKHPNNNGRRLKSTTKKAVFYKDQEGSIYIKCSYNEIHFLIQTPTGREFIETFKNIYHPVTNLQLTPEIHRNLPDLPLDAILKEYFEEE